MGLDFFRRSVELAEQLRAGPASGSSTRSRRTARCSTTSGCAFFKRARLPRRDLSIDGPRDDARRLPRATRAAGTLRPGDARPRRMLRAAGVECQRPVHGPRRERRPRRSRCTASSATSSARAFIQFIPIIERATEETLEIGERRLERQPGREPAAVHAGRLTSSPTARSGRSNTADSSIDVFDEWVRRDVGTRVRADVRRRAGAHWSASTRPLHLLADVRRGARAGAQRRPLLVRPLRRAAVTGSATSTKSTLVELVA